MGFKMKGPSMYPNYKKAKNGGIMVNRSGNPGAADGRAASSPFQMKTDPPTEKAKKHRDSWEPAYEGADYSKKDIAKMTEKEKMRNIDGYEPVKRTTEKRTMRQKALKKASGAAKKGIAEAAGEAVSGLATGAAAGRVMRKGKAKERFSKEKKKVDPKNPKGYPKDPNKMNKEEKAYWDKLAKDPAPKATTDGMKAHVKLTAMNDLTGEKKVLKGGDMKRMMKKDLKTRYKTKTDSLKEGAKKGWAAAKKGMKKISDAAVKSGKLAGTGGLKRK